MCRKKKATREGGPVRDKVADTVIPTIRSN